MQSHRSLPDARLESLARKRAGMRLGWILHAGIFVAVNLLLATLSMLSGRAWAIYPFLGWGLGLAIHGIVVLTAMPGGSLLERLVQQERERLSARNEPR